MKSYDVPILFLIFNRPHSTKLVFEEIKKIKPKKLFIASDGPRPNHPDDILNSKKCREIVSDINWECEVKNLFRDTNLGCKKAVSEAISWFFENVEEGVILEDDCLPNESFFIYSKEMLQRYRNDEKIMMVSGMNIAGSWGKEDSYFFSIYGGVWGWATWRRAWKKYDKSVYSWQVKENQKKIRKNIGDSRQWQMKKWVYDRVQSGEKNSWAYVWEYSRLLYGGLCVVPTKNLVQNIGFGENATHTGKNIGLSLPRINLKFPLTDNMNIKSDKKYDKYFVDKAFGKKEFLFVRILIKTKNFISNIIKRQQFDPGFLGIFIQPFYFIRRELAVEISRMADFIQGETLDAGCGQKPYRKFFNKVTKYIGIDFESPSREKNKNADVLYDGKRFPFGDRSFDSVICTEVLEHVFNPDEFLGEISRVIKKDGWIILSAPFMWIEHDEPHDFGRYSSFGIASILKKHSFKIEAQKKIVCGPKAIFQLINCYIYKKINLKNYWTKLIFYTLLISPFTVLGIIFSFILPKNQSLYLGNVVLAQKHE